MEIVELLVELVDAFYGDYGECSVVTQLDKKEQSAYDSWVTHYSDYLFKTTFTVYRH